MSSVEQCPMLTLEKKIFDHVLGLLIRPENTNARSIHVDDDEFPLCPEIELSCGQLIGCSHYGG